MQSKFILSLRWLGVIAAPLGIALVCMVRPTSAVGENPAPAAEVPPSAFLTSLGLKFEGSATCSGANCHDHDKSLSPPRANYWGNESTLWHSRKDPHHTAVRTLSTPMSKDIATKLKIPLASKSEECLNCHSTLVVNPADTSPTRTTRLIGEGYSAFEAISCNSCHGPSQKYRAPHQQKDWIDAERTRGDHDWMLKNWGLYDTLPVYYRAVRCTSCHLAIKPALVAAGHPQTTFEMNHFSDIYPDRHWHDPDTDSSGAFHAQLWATGQLAEISDAMQQLVLHCTAQSSADEFQKAYFQAKSHYDVFGALITSKAIASADAAALEADVKALDAAVAKNDHAAAGAAAAAAEAHSQAKGLVDAVAAFKADKPAVLQVLAVIAAADTAKLYGPHGEEQQAYAIKALAQAADDQGLLAAVKPILPAVSSQPPKAGNPPLPAEPPKPDDYAKGLEAVRAKVTK